MPSKGTVSFTVAKKGCDYTGILKDNPDIHRKLNERIIKDTTPYVPVDTGALRGSTSIYKNNRVAWREPYAHYQYTGVIYRPNYYSYASMHWWSPPGEGTKHSTKDKLRYHGGGGDHWFEAAKKDHMQDWTSYVKRLYNKKLKGK